MILPRKRLRALVFARDCGVCSECHLDTERVKGRYLAAELTDESRPFYVCPRCYSVRPESGPCPACDGKQMVRKTSRDARYVIEQELSDLGWPIGQIMALRRSGARRFAFWQADHTKPLIEDGADEIGNLRTLCLRCHAQHTTGLRGRLTKTKKAAKKRESRKRHRKDCRRLSWLNEGPCTCGAETTA